jgi:uncharacterized protein
LFKDTKSNRAAFFSGCTGVGLRPEHMTTIIEQRPSVDYFEVLADNYFNQSCVAFDKLLEIAKSYPLSLHSVGLSVATASEPDFHYLDKLKSLAHRLDVDVISDHLCWTNAHGIFTHELMPFPYTEKTLSFIVDKVNIIQQYLNQTVMFENVTRYVNYKQSTLSEAQFLNELCLQTGCGILLDVNNLYVNQQNHGEQITSYLAALDPNNVWQMHLAGFSQQQGYLLDSHSDIVCEQVWFWYQKALALFPQVPTIIEWDNELPEFSVLMQELEKAKKLRNGVITEESSEHAM